MFLFMSKYLTILLRVTPKFYAHLVKKLINGKNLNLGYFFVETCTYSHKIKP